MFILKFKNFMTIQVRNNRFVYYLIWNIFRLTTMTEYCYIKYLLQAKANSYLKEAARAAKEGDFPAFSTTLLVSPWQKHELIAEIGREMAEKYGVQFLYRDFRPGFRVGRARAREMGLYSQKYCGCIFSEKERYL